MLRSNSGKLVIVSVLIVAVVLIAVYYFLNSNDSQITIQSPSHFDAPLDTGITTVQGASLGRLLFNDPLLSRHQKISCASCHQQTASYADYNKQFSTGDRGLFTKRNAPVLINLIWKSHYFADGRAQRLEQTILNAIKDTLELNSDMDLIVERIRQHPVYNKKLKNIFQVKEVEAHHIVDVMTQYLRTLNSWDSNYDRMRQGTYVFTEPEKQGQLLFEQQCTSCHIPPFFQDSTPILTTDGQKLLSPSLRNIKYSGPYMHDGRFKTLDSLLAQHPYEFPQETHRKKLSPEEHQSILIFLNTLTDEQFSNPNSY